MFPKHYFDLFREDIELGTVFVGMDFGPDFLDRRKNVIEASISGAGLKPVIVDTSVINESILMDILKGVQTSQLLLFEISKDNMGQRNGNTLYELGLAHASRLPEETLVLRDDDDKLLFDIQTFRVKKYDPRNIERSKVEIAGHLKSLVANIDRTKSRIIEKTLSLLDDVSLTIIYQMVEQTHFSIHPQTPQQTQIEQRAAIRHLLELGVFRTGNDLGRGQYAYHWTGLGKTIKELIARQRAAVAKENPHDLASLGLSQTP